MEKAWTLYLKAQVWVHMAPVPTRFVTLDKSFNFKGEMFLTCLRELNERKKA